MTRKKVEQEATDSESIAKNTFRQMKFYKIRVNTNHRIYGAYRNVWICFGIFFPPCTPYKISFYRLSMVASKPFFIVSIVKRRIEIIVCS